MTNNTTADTTASGAGEGRVVDFDELKRRWYMDDVTGEQLLEAISTLRAQLEASGRAIAEATVERGRAIARAEAAEADAAMLKEEHDDLFNTLRAASNYVDALGGRSEVYRRVLGRNERPIDAAKADTP